MACRVNPFDNPLVAQRYEDWYSGAGRKASAQEQRLLRKLLDGLHGVKSALEVGAGTGHFTRFLSACGLDVVGLDSSAPMIAEAGRGEAVPYVRGDASALPFRDRSFDLVSFITTLEFVPDPAAALAEAVRTARHGLLLGVLNRHSALALRRSRRKDEIWMQARFFTPRELANLVASAAGTRLQRIEWRTTLWSLPWVQDLPLPMGGFIGLAASLDS
jgi:ubiquinone/menaquinone biosynthesis C-methylase UbiE